MIQCTDEKTSYVLLVCNILIPGLGTLLTANSPFGRKYLHHEEYGPKKDTTLQDKVLMMGAAGAIGKELTKVQDTVKKLDDKVGILQPGDPNATLDAEEEKKEGGDDENQEVKDKKVEEKVPNPTLEEANHFLQVERPQEVQDKELKDKVANASVEEAKQTLSKRRLVLGALQFFLAKQYALMFLWSLYGGEKSTS